MMDSIPLIATAVFIHPPREASRLIVSPYQALPLTRLHYAWLGSDNVAEFEFRLDYGLTDVLPLGKWRISNIPPLPRRQASITLGIHLDQIGQLSVTANWRGQPLTITVSSYGALTQLPIVTLPLERLNAYLHAGQGRGTIEYYDVSHEYGLIAVESTDLLIPFVKPIERDSGLQLFEPDDQVVFTIAHGQVTQVKKTMPRNPRYHHFWCDRCHKSLAYAETTEAYRDGPWGEYSVWTCKACHAEVKPVAEA
jgi:hypothetical protein